MRSGSSCTQQRKAAEDRAAGIKNGVAKVMVMEDQQQRRETFMLQAGLYTNPSAAVQAAVPASLPQVVWRRPCNRLDLAVWLMSEQKPFDWSCGSQSILAAVVWCGAGEDCQ
ncbi:MAG UNVERIFIED_CONTAM: hypothetical protein LVR18_40145 [Planctomycetaceae bacterium]|jgi:hypothetical protein